MNGLEICFYRDGNSSVSFRLVADQHIQELTAMGHRVFPVDINFDRSLRFFMKPTHPASRCPIALVHPFFYHGLITRFGVEESFMKQLKLRHKLIIGIEVADFSTFPKANLFLGNHKDLHSLIVPSRFSKSTMARGGIKKHIEVIPHGVRLHAPSRAFDELRRKRKPKVLIFARGNLRRKGLDLTLEVAKKVKDALFVIVSDPEYNGRAGNIFFLGEWLNEHDLASLYINSDVVMALHRGGAFEIPCLEALAYGRPLVAVGAGAILDYAKTKLGATLVNHGKPNGDGEIEVDISDAVTKLKSVLKNLKRETSKAQSAADLIATEYSWYGVTRLLEKYLQESVASLPTSKRIDSR